MSVTQATVETDMEFVVETLQGMLVGGLSGSLGAGVSTSVGMIKARSARTALTEGGRGRGHGPGGGGTDFRAAERRGG